MRGEVLEGRGWSMRRPNTIPAYLVKLANKYFGPCRCPSPRTWPDCPGCWAIKMAMVVAGKPMKRGKTWAVISCANGELRVMPPYGEEPGFMRRMAVAEQVARILSHYKPED